MPVHHVEGNLFDAKQGTKVVTCNTVGAMGLGIALECKQRYPTVYFDYHSKAIQGMFHPGGVYFTREPGLLLVMTKDHYRDPSRMEWVDNILLTLRGLLFTNPLGELHLPPLGAGSGGLDGRDVLKSVHHYLGDLPNNVYYYLPR